MGKLNLKSRKLQSVGYSFYVSIPPVWLDNVQLCKGDMIKISIDEENKLILEPEEKNDAKTA
jgi:antitoxin component of MazEF toxin-antitoxin module